MAGGYGTNTPTFRTTTSAAKAHSGTRAERLTVSGYASGDAKLLPTLDLGESSYRPSRPAIHTRYEVGTS